MAFGELTPEELEHAVAAIEGFERIFGSQWISDYFRRDEFKRGLEGIVSNEWLKEHFRTGSLPILDIAAAWEDWSLIRGIPGADNLEARWKNGFRSQGLLSELFVEAHLVRAGAQIELEPLSDAGKKADCRFRCGDAEEWIYVEVSKRGEPQDTQENLCAEKIRKKAAKAAARVAPGLLGTVVILRKPNEEEERKIISWLETIGAPAEQKLDDLAVFFVGLPGQGFPGDLDRVARLMRGVMPSNSYCDDSGLGIAWLDVRDNMHWKILKDELDQLPTDKPGIVAIDTSRVVGFKWLPDLASEIFEDEKAVRISALAFFRILHASEGRRIEGKVLFNPRAKKPLHPLAVDMLQKIFLQ